MENITLYNGTPFRIFISIYSISPVLQKSNVLLESGWLEPFCQFKPGGRNGANLTPGNTYRIRSVIEEPEEKIALETSVIIHLSTNPIEIKADNDGIFWWKFFNEKLVS